MNTVYLLRGVETRPKGRCSLCIFRIANCLKTFWQKCVFDNKTIKMAKIICFEQLFRVQFYLLQLLSTHDLESGMYVLYLNHDGLLNHFLKTMIFSYLLSVHTTPHFTVCPSAKRVGRCQRLLTVLCQGYKTPFFVSTSGLFLQLYS